MTTSPVPTITDDLLNELEQAAKSATPGPWELDDNHGKRYLENISGSAVIAEVVKNKSMTWDEFSANSKLISCSSPATVLSLIARIRELEKRQQTLIQGIEAVAELMDNSEGVDGLHQNGDIATWQSLREGGRFEEWLIDFDAALDAVELPK